MRAALCFILLIAACEKRDTGAGPGQLPSTVTEVKPDRLKPSVNAGALWLEYGSNQAKADETYTGRRITVGGDVQSVVKQGEGYAVQFMVSAPGFDSDARPGTVAQFGASETPKVAKLIAGQMCYLQGRCKGRVVGGRDVYTVVIEDCVIIPEPKY